MMLASLAAFSFPLFASLTSATRLRRVAWVQQAGRLTSDF